eukprot:m.895428 g.895428  ORF g.895428 m.895428 type:complete len:50 (+) comp59996_c0_seq3:1700-1849(+)
MGQESTHFLHSSSCSFDRWLLLLIRFVGWPADAFEKYAFSSFARSMSLL